MEKWFKWASNTFALLPGLAIIATNLGTPPGISHLLLGGVIEACGVFTLIFLKQREAFIKKKRYRVMQKSAVWCFVLFVICLIFYLSLFQVFVIYNVNYDRSILFPIWENAGLKDLIAKGTSRNGAIDGYGPEAVLENINNPGYYIAITKTLFILNYLAVFEFLTLGFGVLASVKYPGGTAASLSGTNSPL